MTPQHLGRWLFPLLLAGLYHGPAKAVDAVALELGSGDESANRYGVAAQWDWDARWLASGDWYLGGYWEASFSHWNGSSGERGNGTINEVGLTPVFRYQRQASGNGWGPYAEIAIGAHLLSETELGDKRFSTSFQFGDHVGLGTRFGRDQRLEVGYRFQHLSNAGIKRPNSGINFHILRLSYHF